MSLTEKEIIEKLPSVADWLKWDKNPQTRNEIEQLIKDGNVERLSKLMNPRQCFGTAGIRGLMEPGFSGINDLVIIQTSQGLAKYLKKCSDVENKMVVIGYDGRHNSHRFAKLTANIFLQIGFEVALFSKVVPTPFVSYCTTLLSTCAGIMITSSHNPKQYNGYKVFAHNGAQILPPNDEYIQNSILENLQPWNDEIWNTDHLVYNTKLIDPLAIVFERYYYDLISSATQLDLVKKSNLRIVYTALHGVGHEALTRVFKIFNFANHFPVISQKDPDPEFPTVVFPNPEEGQGVFDESIKTAQENNCTLIFANDPDSDRFCMAELHGKEWRVFNGNEIGALFGWWLWFQYTNNRDQQNKKDSYMISTVVSSKILETMAKTEGFSFIETLTGFKWMANRADDLKKNGKNVLFCFEEAIGFMCGTNVLDKDGISAVATALQMAVYLQSKNQTFLGQLDDIYKRYGFHYSINSYYLCYDQEKIKQIFQRISSIHGPNRYIEKVNDIKVTRIIDLIRNYDSGTEDKKAKLNSTCMLTFHFENGSVITFRTSGTEPKIKYYSEIIANPSETDREKIKNEHKELIESTVKLILQPDQNGLIAKKD